MPIYEYKCNVCKKQFEILVTSSASADGIVCTDCKSPDIRKIISSSSYRLNKGSSISFRFAFRMLREIRFFLRLTFKVQVEP